MPVHKSLLQRACACGGSAGPTGECAECRRKRTLQPKLTVNTPGDRYEQEADRVAAAVMRMPDPASGAAPLGIQRLTAADDLRRQPEEEEEEVLQTKAEPAGPSHAGAAAPPVVHDVLRSPGRPLDGEAQGFMEQRFGYDFGGVRVHADARAADSARAMRAQAFTVGRDVVFGAGRYAPHTSEGKRLLAHELVHTVQQRAARPGSVTLQRQPLEYETAQITIPVLPQGYTLKDANNLIKKRKKAGDLTTATVMGQGAPAGSVAEIFLLDVLSQRGKRDQWGTEVDLIAPIGWPAKQGDPVPVGQVTVRIDQQGNATAELLAAGAVQAPSTYSKKADAIAALKTTYSLKDVKDGTAIWDLTDLNKVVGAFGLLSTTDKAALKDVVLERVQTLPNSRAGEFDYKQEVQQGATTATNRATLRLSNLAFSGDPVSFVGGAGSALPASYQTILHEVAHAVAKQEVREKVGPLHEAMVEQNTASAALKPTVKPLDDAADALNQFVKQYNAAGASGRKKMKPKLDRLRKDYNAKKRAYDPKKKASDAAEKKVKTAQGPADAAKDDSATLASLDKTATARKQVLDTAQQTAMTAASSYQSAAADASKAYRKAVEATTQQIGAYATKVVDKSAQPTDVTQAETQAVQAVTGRNTERSTLKSAQAKNPALADHTPVDGAQDAWLEALRLRGHVVGQGTRLQAFVDFVTKEKIGPFTKYAQDEWPHNPDEFFAEAYSLWKTDPEYLKTNAKKLFDWFQAGSYRP